MRTLLLAAFTAALSVVASNATATLLDDFNDGDDAGWIGRDELTTGGPAVFNASSGKYVLSSTTAVSADRDAVVAYWQDSILNSVFANGLLTARVRMWNGTSNVALIMRTDGAGSAYSFAVNNNLDLLLISRTVSNVDSTLASTSFTVTQGTEYWLGAQILGSDLSLKFWEVGTPEPLAPLLSASDSTFSSGQIELVAYHWGNSQILAGSFDDVQFVPEPSTGLPWIETQCDDGIDNDGDTFVDFPDDPGCISSDDSAEREPFVGLLCDDGFDNDGDGKADFPDDPGCGSPFWPREQPECDDRLDNDGNGFCDTVDSTCSDGSLPGDANCPYAFLQETPICADGVDNDGDGFVDFDDPECTSLADKSEWLACGLGFELVLALPLVSAARRLRRHVRRSPNGPDL